MLFKQNMKLAELKTFAECVYNSGDSIAAMLNNMSLEIELPGVDVSELNLSFDRNTLKISRKEQPEELFSLAAFPNLVANNAKTKLALVLASRMAKTDDPVLISGETGTGKDLFAHLIHQQSPRGTAPLITLHGSTMTSQSAKQQIVDALDQVGAGTLLIDEIHDLDFETQQLLLKILHNPLDHKSFRLITATSIDLEREVRKGRFSAELLAMINGCHIELLPLRQRKEDIADLLSYYIEKLCHSRGQTPQQLSPEALRMLEIYHWPGNVRELVNTVQQLLLAAQDKKTLFAKDLPAHIRIQTLESSALQKKGL